MLNGCVESMAFLGSATTGASSGKIIQSATSSAVSYGVKKQTGKTMPFYCRISFCVRKIIWPN